MMFERVIVEFVLGFCVTFLFAHFYVVIGLWLMKQKSLSFGQAVVATITAAIAIPTLSPIIAPGLYIMPIGVAAGYMSQIFIHSLK